MGDIEQPQGRLQIQRPEVKIRDPLTGKIVETVESDVPDLVYVAGQLPESQSVKKGASILLRYRRGQAFKGDAPFEWKINGEKGELRLISYDGPSLQAGSYSLPVRLEVHNFETDEVDPISWDWLNWQNDIPVIGRSIAALYEAFAEGDETQYATFADALKRHEALEHLLATLL